MPDMPGSCRTCRDHAGIMPDMPGSCRTDMLDFLCHPNMPGSCRTLGIYHSKINVFVLHETLNIPGSCRGIFMFLCFHVFMFFCFFMFLCFFFLCFHVFMFVCFFFLCHLNMPGSSGPKPACQDILHKARKQQPPRPTLPKMAKTVA